MIATSIFGGLLIGLASVSLMLFQGRIAGISSIVYRAIFQLKFESWALTFVIGLVLGPLLVAALNGPAAPVFELAWWQVTLGGLLVGFGMWKVLPLVKISYGVGLAVEFLFAVIKGHEVEEGYLVTGMLVPLIVPIDIPLWMLTVAVVFGVVIGKEVFGGTGMNILNPALTIRAFLFFAYPTWMSGDKVWVL